MLYKKEEVVLKHVNKLRCGKVLQLSFMAFDCRELRIFGVTKSGGIAAAARSRMNA